MHAFKHLEQHLGPKKVLVCARHCAKQTVLSSAQNNSEVQWPTQILCWQVAELRFESRSFDFIVMFFHIILYSKASPHPQPYPWPQSCPSTTFPESYFQKGEVQLLNICGAHCTRDKETIVPVFRVCRLNPVQAAIANPGKVPREATLKVYALARQDFGVRSQAMQGLGHWFRKASGLGMSNLSLHRVPDRTERCFH